jgi:flagellar hook-associated protein 3 FlgL
MSLPGSGTNTIEVLIGLGQALLQDDRPSIESSIDSIDDVFSTLLTAQSKNGARVNRFEFTLDRNEQQSTEATRLLSELEDAEMAETISKFSLTETVYNAALQAASRVIQPSLVNFL